MLKGRFVLDPSARAPSSPTPGVEADLTCASDDDLSYLTAHGSHERVNSAPTDTAITEYIAKLDDLYRFQWIRHRAVSQ